MQGAPPNTRELTMEQTSRKSKEIKKENNGMKESPTKPTSRRNSSASRKSEQGRSARNRTATVSTQSEDVDVVF
jgi:hypothetical protein